MSSLIPITDLTDPVQTVKPFKETNKHEGKIYVRSMVGFFQRIRKWTLSFQMFMYFSFAWINVDGQQWLLFDLSEQKFHLFGMVFWPQDLTLLAFALIISAFGLFFATALFGRVWCGYSCPQTAWTFMFMWLEEFFEGSRNKRISLDSEGPSASKWLKKSGKHASWVLLAFATAFTFVGYFYPIRELASAVFTLSLDSLMTWFWIGFFTVATYMNAGWLREKVCIYMCPYSRFQSVMFNENTMVISYDHKRGEPRHHRARSNAAASEGDCVDCKVCVQVCPVGIDIRDGLQYECIGCALCIDACDGIMEKIGKPKGLIRYASDKEIETGEKAKTFFDGRTLGYGAMMMASVLVFATMMLTRPDVEMSALRDRGALFKDNGLGQIENNYILKLVNKTDAAHVFALSIPNHPEMSVQPTVVRVEAGAVENQPVVVVVDPFYLSQSTSEIEFSIVSERDSGLNAQATSKFLGPVNPY